MHSVTQPPQPSLLSNVRGITIQDTIGVGDKVQFSSLPENYFRTTGKKLIDISHSWIFDHNPYVIRGMDVPETETFELWNFSPNLRPRPRPMVYLSNAEHAAGFLNAKVFLNRPRLYRFEDFPFEKRTKILLHIDGVSQGIMPDHVIDHALRKYKGTGCLYQIGTSERDLGIPVIKTPTIWDLAKELSEAKMLIGMDSGPSWIAACYPDVIVKKLRMKPSVEHFKTWVPLEIDNIHSHWDDRCFQIFNSSEDDVGFTSSFRKI